MTAPKRIPASVIRIILPHKTGLLMYGLAYISEN